MQPGGSLLPVYLIVFCVEAYMHAFSQTNRLLDHITAA